MKTWHLTREWRLLRTCWPKLLEFLTNNCCPRIPLLTRCDCGCLYFTNSAQSGASGEVVTMSRVLIITRTGGRPGVLQEGGGCVTTFFTYYVVIRQAFPIINIVRITRWSRPCEARAVFKHWPVCWHGNIWAVGDLLTSYYIVYTAQLNVLPRPRHGPSDHH